MSHNLAHCNHCAGSIILSLDENTIRRRLVFCCEQCADDYFSPDNPELCPVGLAEEMGVEEYQ